MDNELVCYREEGGIGWITLNRPEVLNALNADVLRMLALLLDRIKEDQGVGGVIVSGSGEKAFSAGADIRYLSTATPLAVRELALLAVGVNARIENLGKVSIAAINGYALGGGLELAESCTFRVAARHARMGHPEVRIGAISGWGGTTRLARLVGKGHAAELLLTGKQVDAEEAHGIGLVNKVVEKEHLRSESEKLLRDILSLPPVAVRMTWEALHRGLNMTAEESILLGADYFGLVAASEDFREGTTAFVQKKAPRYRGR
ncbi:MAG: enoyl-CoA hydratase/isomerase family protein [Thermodesulfovibrionales bacterium]